MISIYKTFAAKRQKLKNITRPFTGQKWCIYDAKVGFCNAKSLNFKGKTMLFRTKKKAKRK